MIDIRMSPEVAEFLGAEMTTRVREAPLAQAKCPICGDPVPAAGPVNVMIAAGTQGGTVAYAHTTCAPSIIVPAPTMPLDTLLPDEGPMSMSAVLIEHGRSALPCLVAEVPVQVFALPPGQGTRGELTNAIVSALLQHGLSLITRLREAPRTRLDWTATLTPGTPDHHLVITRPPTAAIGNDLFYEGTVPVSAAWSTALAAYGWCVLYSGTGLADPVTNDLTAASLRTAATAGTLTGARLTITTGDPQ